MELAAVGTPPLITHSNADLARIDELVRETIPGIVPAMPREVYVEQGASQISWKFAVPHHPGSTLDVVVQVLDNHEDAIRVMQLHLAMYQNALEWVFCAPPDGRQYGQYSLEYSSGSGAIWVRGNMFVRIIARDEVEALHDIAAKVDQHLEGSAIDPPGGPNRRLNLFRAYLRIPFKLEKHSWSSRR
jgi:hypothetical protein